MMNLRSEPAECRTTPKFLSLSRRIYCLLALTVTVADTASARTIPTVHKVDVANGAWVKRAYRACEGEVAGKSPLQVALRHYVKAAEPIPRRFLTVVGSDSALSEMGTKVLGEFGPTYYYAGSDAVKAALKDKLERVGPYPALLVVLRGNKKVNANTQSIRLGGHYVSGEFDGKVATSRAYTLNCVAAGWVIKESKEESAK